jgi:hypothetical protein
VYRTQIKEVAPKTDSVTMIKGTEKRKEAPAMPEKEEEKE